jgi:hypothetical protein
MIKRINTIKALLTLCLVIILASESIISQTLDDPLITDRPDATESAFTVPMGSFQIETGIVYESTELGNNYQDKFSSLNIATTLLRYGLWNNIELRFGTMYTILTDEFGMPGNEETQTFSGINRILLSAKFHVHGEKGILPEASLIANVRFPTGDFGNENRYALFLAASHTLSDVFGLGYNIGTAKEEGDWMFIYSLALGAGVSNKVGVFAEVFGNFTQENQWFDTGLTYLINNDLQLDASVGFGLDTHFPDWFVNGGVSIRIPG